MQKTLLQLMPARDWREATPIGNGRIGALVHGRASDERITLNHEALYNWSVHGEMPDISPALPEVRRLIGEGRFAEADALYPELLRKAPNLGRSGKFLPAFDLRMRFEADGAFRDYSRELDLARGICSVCWRDDGGKWERIAFAHCAAGAGGPVVVRARRDGRPFSATISLPRHDLIDFPGYGGWDTFETLAQGRGILSSCRTPDGLDFCGYARILATDGRISDPKSQISQEPSALNRITAQPHNGNLVVSSATYIDILVDLHDSPRSAGEFEDILAQYTGKSFDTLLDEHAAAFSERFTSSTISITDESSSQEANDSLLLDSFSGHVDKRLVEKMSDFSRYLLLACSGFGCSRPANLQGVWNGDYSPAWGGTYFFDENVEMAYWQALLGNIPETLLPLFDLCDRFMDDFRANAMRLYGCRGILLPLYMDDRSGLAHNTLPHCVYWTGAAAWIAAFHFNYWRHTGDNGFLRNRAWPFMREAALFYEDFLVKGEDGKLHACPSVSPENCAMGDFAGAGKVSVAADATMDFALVRELLGNCLSAADAIGFDGPETVLWREMLALLPPYKTNERGALREWLDDRLLDNDRHRHLSHLYPLFPGGEITRRGTPELFKAACRAADARFAHGLADQTGWSLAHMACVWARLGEGDKALSCLELILRCCTGTNLFTYHNDWRGMGVTLELLHGTAPPVQLDAAFGFRAAVQEMLLGIEGDVIVILPALPTAWKSGSARGLKGPGGLGVDIDWSPRGCVATLRIADGFNPAHWRIAFGAGETTAKDIGHETVVVSNSPAATPS